MPKDITNRKDIQLLVDTFYHKVQQDADLNHVFNTVAQLDWEAHLPKMYDFWQSVIFGQAMYKGNPLKHHQELHAKYHLSKALFITWEKLFIATVDEFFEGPHATKAKQSALSISTVLQTKTIY